MKINTKTKESVGNSIQKLEIYFLKLKKIWLLVILSSLINACAPTYFTAAWWDYTDGNYDEAIRQYTKALPNAKSKEWVSTVYRSRGQAYHAKGDYDQALTDFDNAISVHPSSAWVYSLRASTYRAKREYARAKADHNKAIALEPDGLDVYFFRRGVDMFLMAEYEQAIKDLRKTIQLKSDSDQHPQTFAWLYLAMERAGENGREVLENGLRKFNSNKWPAHILSMYLGDIAPGTVFVEAFKVDNKKNITANRCAAYFHMAESYLLKDNKEKAIEMFKKSQEYPCPKDVESDATKEELRRLES